MNRNIFDLSGRTALVTGASRGIGQAIAIGLAEAGADILALARGLDGLEGTQAAVRALGRNCLCIQADLAASGAIEQAFDTIGQTGTLPDILINNAGTEQLCAAADVEEAVWDRIVNTNLRAAFFVAQHFARPLLQAGRHASIVNLGSLTSAVGVPAAAPYTASKSGILGLTRALSTEWSPVGIRVNAIGPGYFRTALTGAFYRDDKWRAQMLDKIPMQRFGQLADLQGTAIFLASEASAYITGQIVYVDGGYLASI